MPTTSKPATIATLNELIQLDADSIQLYDKGIQRVDDPTVKRDLEAFKADLGRHVAELTQVVFDLGGQAKVARRDLTGIVLDTMITLREATGITTVLEALRTAEKLANKTYESAAELRLPQAASRVVMRNLDDARRHLAAIELHLDRLARIDGTGPDDDRDFEDIEITDLDEVVIIELDDAPLERA